MSSDTMKYYVLWFNFFSTWESGTFNLKNHCHTSNISTPTQKSTVHGMEVK